MKRLGLWILIIIVAFVAGIWVASIVAAQHPIPRPDYYHQNVDGMECIVFYVYSRNPEIVGISCNWDDWGTWVVDDG
jgi:hypothetical protein